MYHRAVEKDTMQLLLNSNCKQNLFAQSIFRERHVCVCTFTGEAVPHFSIMSHHWCSYYCSLKNTNAGCHHGPFRDRNWHLNSEWEMIESVWTNCDGSWKWRQGAYVQCYRKEQASGGMTWPKQQPRQMIFEAAFWLDMSKARFVKAREKDVTAIEVMGLSDR